jgi:hypothetical protein
MRARLSSCRSLALLLNALLTAASNPTSAAEPHSSSIIPLNLNPRESVLLLDDHTVAKTSNLRQEFYRAEKFTGPPALRRSEPWEGVGPYVWGTRLLQDPVSRELRLYYTAYSFQGNAYRMGVATSHDGINWTKPKLNLGQVGGAPASNWIPIGSHADKGVLSIARDPRPQTPADRQFLGIRFTYDGELISFSPDGIHWTEYSDNPVWHVPSDIIHLMWDENRSRFTAYYKVWEVRGSEVRPDGSLQPIVAYMPSFDQKQIGSNIIELSGPRISFVTNGPAIVTNSKLQLRATKQAHDDGGGSSLSGDWTGKRVQAWAESDDGIHWSNEQVVLRADERDPPTANIQYMFVIHYGAYYLGFPTLHDERGLFSIQLAWSSDGLHWNRSCRTPWLDHGPAGAFDSGMVLGPTDPVLLEREMLFPYGGFPITHDSPRQDWEAAIGLARLRLDGFSAWKADATGELVTQPFICNGDSLIVNADGTNGSIAAEILNQKGKPIAGFEAHNCLTLSSSGYFDSLQFPSHGQIIWRKKKDLKSLHGKTIQLRFLLNHARIFSFRIATRETLLVPRATTM